jgi:MFS family permease
MGPNPRGSGRAQADVTLPLGVRALIVVSALQSLATAGFSTYVGIWAIQSLHAGAAALGVALFLRAGSGVLTGYAGGRISDDRGRRPVIIASWGAQAVCIGAFAFVHGDLAVGLALIVAFGPLGPPGRAAAAAYIADATESGQRPVAFASQRSAQALAQIVGPAVAALLVGDSRWSLMFGVLGGFSLFAVVVAAFLLPRQARRVDAAPQSAESQHSGSLWRDHPYLAFLAAATAITLAMAATDRFLPIAAVASYGVPTQTWGLVAVLNPALVILLQRRLTRRSEIVSVPARIAGAGALTGLPFLLLLPFGGTPVVVAIVLLSTLGEMVWMPLSQALAADLAPPHRVGAYLGAFDGAVSLAYALGPMLALELSAVVRIGVVWIVFAAIAVFGAAAGLAAYRSLRSRSPDAELSDASVEATTEVGPPGPG